MGNGITQSLPEPVLPENIFVVGYFRKAPKLVGHHMDWLFLDESAVNNLVEYEARLNHVLSKYNDPLICNSNASPFIPLAA